MEQIELYHNETPCTANQSKVFIEDKKVYQHTTNYFDISNKDQMLKIVERLTLEEGYIMESDKKIKSGSLHFILLENIGSAVVQNNINKQSIINVLEAL